MTLHVATTAPRDRWAVAAVTLAAAALAVRSPGWWGLGVLAVVGAVGLVAAPAGAGAPARRWLVATGAGVAAFALVRFVAPTVPLPPPSALGLAAAAAAGVAEEALFRGAMFELLGRRWGDLGAVLGAAAAFAIVHVPAYGWRALPLDLAAGVLFGWQRSVTGTWTSPAATHAAANLMLLGVSA